MLSQSPSHCGQCKKCYKFIVKLKINAIILAYRYKTEGGSDEDTDLRKSSIHLLLSMLCLPLQYGQTPIRGTNELN